MRNTSAYDQVIEAIHANVVEAVRREPGELASHYARALRVPTQEVSPILKALVAGRLTKAGYGGASKYEARR